MTMIRLLYWIVGVAVPIRLAIVNIPVVFVPLEYRLDGAELADIAGSLTAMLTLRAAIDS